MLVRLTPSTLVYSGRPLRTLVTPYVADWEARPEEIRKLCDSGVVPIAHDAQEKEKNGEDFNVAQVYPMLMGQACGNIGSVLSAQEIVDEIMSTAVQVLQSNFRLLGPEAVQQAVTTRKARL